MLQELDKEYNLAIDAQLSAFFVVHGKHIIPRIQYTYINLASAYIGERELGRHSMIKWAKMTAAYINAYQQDTNPNTRLYGVCAGYA